MSKWTVDRLNKYMNKKEERYQPYDDFVRDTNNVNEWSGQKTTPIQTSYEPKSYIQESKGPTLNYQSPKPMSPKTEYMLTETLNQMYAEKKEREKRKPIQSAIDSVKRFDERVTSKINQSKVGRGFLGTADAVANALGKDALERGIETIKGNKYSKDEWQREQDKRRRTLLGMGVEEEYNFSDNAAQMVGGITGQLTGMLTGTKALGAGATALGRVAGNAAVAGTQGAARSYGEGNSGKDVVKDAAMDALFYAAGTAGSEVLGNAMGVGSTKLGQYGREALKGLSFDAAGYAATLPTYAMAGDQMPTGKEIATDMIAGALFDFLPNAVEVSRMDLPMLKKVRSESKVLTPEVAKEIDRRIYEMQEGYSIEPQFEEGPKQLGYSGVANTKKTYYGPNGMPIENKQGLLQEKEFTGFEDTQSTMPYNSENRSLDNRYYDDNGINKLNPYNQTQSEYRANTDQYGEKGNKAYNFNKKDAPYPELYDTYFEMMYGAGINNIPYDRLPKTEFDTVFPESMKKSFWFAGQNDRGIESKPKSIAEPKVVKEQPQTLQTLQTHEQPKPQTQQEVKYQIEEKQIMGDRQKQVYDYLHSDKDGKKAKAYYLSPELKGVDEIKRVLGTNEKLIKFTDDKAAPKLDVMKMEMAKEFPEVEELGLEEFGTWLVDNVENYKSTVKEVSTMKREARELPTGNMKYVIAEAGNRKSISDDLMIKSLEGVEIQKGTIVDIETAKGKKEVYVQSIVGDDVVLKMVSDMPKGEVKRIKREQALKKEIEANKENPHYMPKEVADLVDMTEESMRSKSKLKEKIAEIEEKKKGLSMDLQFFAEKKLKQYKSLYRQLESEGLSQTSLDRVKELQAERNRYKKEAERNYINNEVNKLKAKEAKVEAVTKEKQKGAEKLETTKEKMETKHNRELNKERMKAALEKDDIKTRAETKLEKTIDKHKERMEKLKEEKRYKVKEAAMNERWKAAGERDRLEKSHDKEMQKEKISRDIERFKNVQAKNKRLLAKKIKHLKHIKRNLKTLNPEFKARIEPLMDFILDKKIGAESSFDLEKFKVELEKHGLPTDIEDDAITSKMIKSMIERVGKTIKVSDMSFDDFNEVYEAVATLVHANKTMNKFIRKSRYVSMKESVNVLKENMTKKHGENGGRKLNKKTGRYEQKKRNFLKGLNDDLETILTTIVKIEGQNGPLKEVMYDGFMEGHTRKFDFERRTNEFFKERFKDIDIKSLEKGKYTVNTEQGEVELTSLEKVTIALNSFNDKNRYSILESGFSVADNKKTVYKMDELELERLISDLTDNELKLMDTLFEYYETINKQGINDVSMKLFNYEVANEEWYYPKKVNTDYAVVKEIDGMGEATMLNHLMSGNLENAGFMKSKRMTKTPILLENPLELAVKMSKEVGEMYAYAVPLRDAKLMLKKAKTDIEYTYGSHGYKRLLDYVNSYTEGGYTKTNSEKLYNKGTSNVVKAIFGLNVGTVAKQPLGLFNAANEIEARYIAKAMGRKLNPVGQKAIKERMLKYAPMTYERAMGNVNKDFNNHSLEKDVKRSFYGKTSIFDKATLGIAKADQYLCNTIWLASEYKVRHDNPELTGEAFYKRVGALTEEIIITSQGGPLNTHTSPLFAKEDIVSRTMTRFQTQANASYNQALIAAEKFKDTEGVISKAKASGQFVESMLRTVALPTLLAIGVDLGVEYFTNEDKSKVKKIQKSVQYGNDNVLKETLGVIGDRAIEEMLGVNTYMGVLKDFVDEIVTGYSNDDVVEREVKTFAGSVKMMMDAKGLEGWEVYASGPNKGENKKEVLIEKAGEGMIKSLGKMLSLPVNWGTKLYNIATDNDEKKTDEDWKKEMTDTEEREVKKDYNKAVERYKATGEIPSNYSDYERESIKNKGNRSILNKLKKDMDNAAEEAGEKSRWKKSKNGKLLSDLTSTAKGNPEKGERPTTGYYIKMYEDKLDDEKKPLSDTERKSIEKKLTELYKRQNDLYERRIEK